MAKNTAMFSFLVMILVLFDVTMATQIYRVGDYVGWNNSTKVDYSKWSASKNFQVGDFLMFEFNPSDDNVFRVSAEDFAACRAPSPLGLPSTGQEFYPLDRPGRWYFVCSIPGRCESGQKLEILVHSMAASVPSPPPSSSPAPTNLPAIMAPSPTNPPAIMAPSPTNPPAIMAPSPTIPPAIMAPSPTNPPAIMAHSPTNQPETMAPPQEPSPPSSSSPAASSPSSGKLSPDLSPSNSPADQKSGSVAGSVNFWLAMVAVSFYVCSIA